MIGVFDSGSGGLSVLAALQERMPRRDFLYYGDHAHAPYGTRPPADIDELTRTACNRLFTAGCGLVVLACNTAAAVALRRLQREWLPRAWPERRILGVHVPLVEALTGETWRPRDDSSHSPHRQRIGNGEPDRAVVIFATPTTVASHAFSREIARHDPALPVIEQPCPGLAEAIEGHAPEDELVGLIWDAWQRAAGEASAKNLRITRAALACTHYPLIEPVFRQVLPEDITILTQPALVATALESWLDRHPRIDPPGSGRCLLRTSAPDGAARNGFAARLTPALPAFAAWPVAGTAS